MCVSGRVRPTFPTHIRWDISSSRDDRNLSNLKSLFHNEINKHRKTIWSSTGHQRCSLAETKERGVWWLQICWTPLEHRRDLALANQFQATETMWKVTCPWGFHKFVNAWVSCFGCETARSAAHLELTLQANKICDVNQQDVWMFCRVFPSFGYVNFASRSGVYSTRGEKSEGESHCFRLQLLVLWGVGSLQDCRHWYRAGRRCAINF